jgi:hypothetical protein
MSNQLNPRDINPTPRTKPVPLVADANYVLKEYDSYVILASTTGAVKTVTLPPGNGIRRVYVRMSVNTAGTYTVAVSGGLVLFAAANQAATFISESSSTGVAIWTVESLFGATFV